jgi:hypothetical protein
MGRPIPTILPSLINNTGACPQISPKSVLLITIFGSLLLGAVFVIAFAAERRSRSMSAPNPERDALLPFDEDPPKKSDPKI